MIFRALRISFRKPELKSSSHMIPTMPYQYMGKFLGFECAEYSLERHIKATQNTEELGILV